MSTGFTVGTVVFGLALLVWEASVWWPGVNAFKGKKVDPWGIVQPLIPFVLTWCTGALCTLCVGGAVGMMTGALVWGAGWVGDAAYVWGVGGDRMAAPRASGMILTAGGRVMALLALVIFAARRRQGATASKWRGFCSGVTLALSAGVASSVAVPLASAANIAGVWITGLTG